MQAPQQQQSPPLSLPSAQPPQSLAPAPGNGYPSPYYSATRGQSPYFGQAGPRVYRPLQAAAPPQVQEAGAGPQMAPAPWPRTSLLDPMQAAFGAAYDGYCLPALLLMEPLMVRCARRWTAAVLGVLSGCPRASTAPLLSTARCINRCINRRWGVADVIIYSMRNEVSRKPPGARLTGTCHVGDGSTGSWLP